MTNDGQFAYVWDDADRLVEVRRGSQVVVACRYDGVGRRRERIVTAGYEGGPSTNRYVYHGWQVLEVRDGGNAALESYVHGPDLSGTLAGAGGIGGIVSCSTGGTNRWFHYDGNGNVARVTDGSRGVVSALEYAPFGAVILRSGNYTPRHAFSSKEWDAAVGLSYYGYRYYSPGMGRWIGRDPLGRYGTKNLYEAFGNDPASGVDPSGLYVVRDYGRPAINTVVCDGKGGFRIQIGTYLLNRPDMARCLSDCVRRHEESHLEDVRAASPDICVGKDDGMVIAPSDPEERKYTEQKAASAALRCLTGMLERKCPPRGCLQYIQGQIAQEKALYGSF